MIQCPQCGCSKHKSKVTIEEIWTFDCDGVSIEKLSERVIHNPGLEDYCICCKCGYSAKTKEFIK